MSKHKWLIAGMALVGALSFAEAAMARGACGVGWHRGPRGHCVRNAVVVPVRPVVVAPTTTVVVVPSPAPSPTVAIIYAPIGKPCPIGYHLGRQGRRCWPN